MWRHHLIGEIFLLMSDNISLKYLFDKQNLNVRQARWLAFLSEYDFVYDIDMYLFQVLPLLPWTFEFSKIMILRVIFMNRPMECLWILPFLPL